MAVTVRGIASPTKIGIVGQLAAGAATVNRNSHIPNIGVKAFATIAWSHAQSAGGNSKTIGTIARIVSMARWNTTDTLSRTRG